MSHRMVPMDILSGSRVCVGRFPGYVRAELREVRRVAVPI